MTTYSSTFKHVCNVAFINVRSKFVLSKVFISIVVVSPELHLCVGNCNIDLFQLFPSPSPKFPNLEPAQRRLQFHNNFQNY